MNLPTQHLNPALPLPAYARDDDAGADLRATTTVTLAPGARALVPTGVAVAIPTGHVGLLVARSSLAVKKAMTLANGVGVIDSDYRGEIKIPIIPLDGCHNLIQAGQKIAQLIILPIALPTVEVVAELPDSERGAGGFGSTGH